jgi:DNA-binding CsgD family transcriptional regulator
MKKNELSNIEFIQFNEHIQSFLLDVCSPLFNNFDFSSFGYTKYRSDGSRMVLETNQEWFELYSQFEFDEKMDGPSSLLHNIANITTNELHSNILIGKPKTKLHEILFSLNMWNSISIYVKSEKYIEIFHLSTSTNNEKIVEFYVNHKDLLKRFIYYFREKLHDINIKNIPYTFPNDPYNIFQNLIGEEKKAPENLMIDTFIKKTALEKFYLLTHDMFISKREMECLHYLSLGKSAKEIGRVLKISPRTVETYLLNIKKKLELNTKSDLINLSYKNHINEFFIK